LRRRRLRGLDCELDAEVGQAPAQVGHDVLELMRGSRLRARHERGLRVRRPQQPPAAAPADADAVDVVERDAFVPQLIPKRRDDCEFLLFRTVDADLRGVGERRQFVPQQV
jgi:hypothetical protein